MKTRDMLLLKVSCNRVLVKHREIILLFFTWGYVTPQTNNYYFCNRVQKGVLIFIPSTEIIKTPNEENKEIPNIEVLNK